MNKRKLIATLSITGLLALTGTAYALASGSPALQAVQQTLGIKPTACQPGPAQSVSPAGGIKTGIVPAVNQTPPTQSGPSQAVTPPSVNTVPGNGAAPSPAPGPYGYGMMGGSAGGGYGMMGGYAAGQAQPGQAAPYGYGMMGGNRGYGMMGGNGGYGMMGGYDAAGLGVNLANGQVASPGQALVIAKAYAQKLTRGFTVDEMHEFSDSYEVELNDSNGQKAFEFLILKNGGRIYAEMGPNMMWNTKYGPMAGGSSATMTVSQDQAMQTAKNFVTSQLGQGYSVQAPDLAPGYYEFTVKKGGKDFAELDVNGYSGQVWYETWHGPIIQTIEAK